MQKFCCMLTLIGVALVANVSTAQPTGDESADYQTESVLSGLDNPWGIAVRADRKAAGPHELFVAESGAGRVIRVTTDRPEDVHEVVVGMPIGSLGTGPSFRVGPLGLVFISRTKLVVTGGGEQDVRVYALPGDGSKLAADEFDHSVQPTRTAEEVASTGLLAVAANDSSAYITWGGAAHRGKLLKAYAEANRLDTLRTFLTQDQSGAMDAPAGVAITPSDRPQFLVVAQQGGFDAVRDSRLTFYTLDGGALALNLETSLHDIMGLAYSASGNLYAVDFAWNAAGQGGIYRLDDARHEGRQVCRPVKIATVTRGVALAFAPDGALYVTTLGEGENEKNGELLKVTGEF